MKKGKERFTKKQVAVLMTVATLITTVCMSTLKMGVKAAGIENAPGVSGFVTPSQLMDPDIFTLHTDNGRGVAQKVAYGNKTWYIAGMDAGNLVLISDPTNSLGYSEFLKDDNFRYDYELKDHFHVNYPTEYANSYKVSDVRNYLNEQLDIVFSSAEQKYMVVPTVYTDIYNLNNPHASSYFTEDKLYLAYGDAFYENRSYITVGTNRPDSLNSGIKIAVTSDYAPDGSPFVFDRKSGKRFWLRSPYSDVSVSYNVCIVDAAEGVGSQNVNDSYLVVPAFHLNMSSVLFASSVTASSETPFEDALTLRMDGSGMIMSSAVYDSEGIRVTNGSDNDNESLRVAKGVDNVKGTKDLDNEYLYVLYSEGETVKVYSKEITGDLSISKECIGVDSIEDCKIWIEKKDTISNLTYAVMATKGSNGSTGVIGHIFGDFSSNGDATCGANGTKTRSCVVCGYDETIEDENSATGNHSFSECVPNGDGTHKVVCENCDAVQQGHDRDACFGGTATCKEKAKCTVCGQEYGSLVPHKYDKVWKTDATNHWHVCTVCKAKKDTAAHSLATTTTKATTTKNGKKETKCSVCSRVTKTETIYAAKTIKLAKDAYVYDGKAKKPAIIVKDSNGNAIATTNYTVTYQTGRKKVGRYSVKITFKGDYSGSKSLSFVINAKATTIKSVLPGLNAFTIKWAKQTEEVSGYEIHYAPDKNFKSSAKKVNVKKNTTTTKEISGLKSKKTYYVRIRTYKKVGNEKYYSAWSKVMEVKTK